VKTSKHRSNGIRDNFKKNLIFLKLKLGCQPNKTANSTNSKAELLYAEVGEAELSLMK
jgi:hypothetical protein